VVAIFVRGTLTGFVPWNSAVENARKIQLIGAKISNLTAIVQAIN